jgi:hypothetical protein
LCIVRYINNQGTAMQSPDNDYGGPVLGLAFAVIALLFVLVA